MKVLNLYAGIGGNRKLWEDVEVTAVEIDENIAKIYQDFFPDDTVIVEDAHQYLLEHYKEFDFIWSSPPCPTHSTIRKNSHNMVSGKIKPVYPDMKLYEEIIFLTHYYRGKWVVENVIAYYKPLIRPQTLQRHHFWVNYWVKPLNGKADKIAEGTIAFRENNLGYDLSNYKNIDKTKILRNCVHPELGLHIFKCMNERELKLAL